PVLYPTANVPQAWAAGTVFHLVQAILGLQADAPNRRLYVDPELPPWLRDLTLRGMRIGQARVDLRFWREGGRSYWVLLAREGDITVVQKAWQPWAVPVSR